MLDQLVERGALEKREGTICSIGSAPRTALPRASLAPRRIANRPGACRIAILATWICEESIVPAAWVRRWAASMSPARLDRAAKPTETAAATGRRGNTWAAPRVECRARAAVAKLGRARRCDG